MIKDVKFGEESRKGILNGVNTLGNAVKITLGAKGMLVFCTDPLGEPFATKDGITVADDLNLPDGLEQMTCRFMKQGTRKTQDEAGDGTTTATVLAQSIVNNAFKQVEEKCNPILLKRGLDLALNDALEILDELAIDVDDKKHLMNVAKISSNGDDLIASLVSEAYEKVGTNGIVTLKESSTNYSHLSYDEGAVFDSGVSNMYFRNDPETGFAVHKDAVIVIIDEKIQTNKQLKKFLPLVTALHPNKNIIILAHKVESEAIASLLVNHRAADTVELCPIDSPKFGFERLEFLEDIAALTGARVISKKNGFGLDDVHNLYVDHSENNLEIESPFGDVSGIISQEDQTIIEVYTKKTTLIEKRVKEIKRLIEAATAKEKEEELKERLSRFESGIATIHVGTSTKGETRELKDRIDDSINSVRAALDEGIVEGGGAALMRVKKRLTALMKEKDFNNQDIQIGYKVLIDSLSAPLEAIVKNGGGQEEVVANKVYKSNKKGYDVITGEYVNMLDAGIIDPKKVTRCALQNAVSISGTLIGVGCSLVDTSSKILAPEQFANLRTQLT